MRIAGARRQAVLLQQQVLADHVALGRAIPVDDVPIDYIRPVYGDDIPGAISPALDLVQAGDTALEAIIMDKPQPYLGIEFLIVKNNDAEIRTVGQPAFETIQDLGKSVSGIVDAWLHRFDQMRLLGIRRYIETS